ncbi:hypothetical protein ABMY26_07080 (plasmid) [Azospirillum sp. HJ39]|uniref:hypothetical protein n=1 Tax=Azospirillum sp. HJ39 TaxID=3159496 RepID=UPI0035583901
MTDEQFWAFVRTVAAAETTKDRDPRSHGDLFAVLLERAAAEGDISLAYSILRTYSGMDEYGAVWPDDWLVLLWDAIRHAGAAGEASSAGFLAFAIAVQQGEWWSAVSPGNLPAILFETPEQPMPEDAVRLRKLVEWAAGKIANSGKELEVFVRNGGAIETTASHGYGFDMGARRVRTHHSDVLRAVAQRYLPPEWRWQAIEPVGGETQIVMGEYRPPRIERIIPGVGSLIVAEISRGRRTAPLGGKDLEAAINAMRTGRIITKAEMAAWGVR